MNIKVSIDEKDIKAMVLERLQHELPNITLPIEKVHFEVKTNQNYKAEWEEGNFRVSIDVVANLVEWRGLFGT